MPAPAATASHVVPEREIDITEVHLGMTPRGNVGVYVSYTPARPRSVVLASVSVGARPRIVFGFYESGRALASPLKGTYPNMSNLRAGRSYRVSISFCRTDRGSLGGAAPGPGMSVASARGAVRRPAVVASQSHDTPVAHAAKERCATRSFVTTRAFLHRRFAPPAAR